MRGNRRLCDMNFDPHPALGRCLWDVPAYHTIGSHTANSSRTTTFRFQCSHIGHHSVRLVILCKRSISPSYLVPTAKKNLPAANHHNRRIDFCCDQNADRTVQGSRLNSNMVVSVHPCLLVLESLISVKTGSGISLQSYAYI